MTISSFAQEVKVVDKETGKPIDNVTVFTEKQTFNSSTNEKGIVDITSVKDTETLVFSHISYALKSKLKSDIKGKNYTVYLTRQSEQLDEVVLSVFKGQAKTKRVAEQVAVITSKEIQQLSPQTTADLLASRYELHKWDSHQIVVPSEQDKLKRAVEGSMYAFKL